MASYIVTPISGSFGTQIQIIGTNLPSNPVVNPYISLYYTTPSYQSYTFTATQTNVSTGSAPYTCTWTGTITSPSAGGFNSTANIPQSPFTYSLGISTLSGTSSITVNSNFFLTETICFNVDTKISCFKNNIETDIEIQNLKKGDLIKTIKNGFMPVNAIGKSLCYNPKNKERTKSRMFRLKKEKYPELKEDLIITGGHSVLVPNLSIEKYDEIIRIQGKMYATDDMYRLPAYLDDRSDIYTDEYGDITVYHISLGEDEKRNYGIYANGLLVESCFIPRIRNEMTIIS
jgi:hypothetical protein